MTVFRHPGSTYEGKDEYFWCTDSGLGLFLVRLGYPDTALGLFRIDSQSGEALFHLFVGPGLCLFSLSKILGVP